jgi:hypothetical protein
LAGSLPVRRRSLIPTVSPLTTASRYPVRCRGRTCLFAIHWLSPAHLNSTSRLTVASSTSASWATLASSSSSRKGWVCADEDVKTALTRAGRRGCRTRTQRQGVHGGKVCHPPRLTGAPTYAHSLIVEPSRDSRRRDNYDGYVPFSRRERQSPLLIVLAATTDLLREVLLALAVSASMLSVSHRRPAGRCDSFHPGLKWDFRTRMVARFLSVWVGWAAGGRRSRAVCVQSP